MKHHWHLSINTVVTVISLAVICVLLYWVTIKQDTRYQDILTLINKQQNNLETEQSLRQGLEREWYNWKYAQPQPTMETLTIDKEALK